MADSLLPEFPDARTWLAQILSQLVQLPSVNPMGGAIDPAICFEHRVTDRLCQWLADWELPWERQIMEPGRENVVTRLDGHPDAPVLLIEVHQDTVPITGMTIAPFGGELRDGRIYGRGACDVKGGMASILGLLQLIQRSPGRWPTVVVAFCVNEEFGFSGARLLHRGWESATLGILASPPDCILVTEPTECHVVVSHKGVVRWNLVTHGRAAHSSQPQVGVNAIYRMARVLQALAEYAGMLPTTGLTDRLLGGPTLSVGTISGGISANTVPDRCSIAIDRRLLPDEEPEVAYQQAVQHLATVLDNPDWLEHEPPFMVSRGLSHRGNVALARLLQRASSGRIGAAQLVGAHYGTDASELGCLGIPTVVFGPGAIAQAHTADEWIEVEQLELATAILGDFCRLLAGGHGVRDV